MRLRLVLSSIVLAALAANPCLAKDGHAHAVRASTANNGASGKGASGTDASGTNPAPSKANVPIDAEAAVAPPVLPPHGAQQQIRINPSVKTTNPGISSHRPAGLTPITAPTARNAIGQAAVVSPKNLPDAQPPLPAVRGAGAVSPPIIHGGPTAPPVWSGTARVNVANGTNRGNVNGATVIRPATGPAVIGGPAQTRYGINGTTVQNRH
jgi:hypothetical protein